MNRMLIRLWSMMDGEDSNSINYQIANTLVNNMSSIRQTSCSALAKLCSVSKPSISRFSRELGYDDFYEFRAELSTYYSEDGKKYNVPEAAEGCRGFYLDSIRNNLDVLSSQEINQKIELLVEDIHQYKKVYLLGNMQCGCTAANLQYNLRLVKKDIFAVGWLTGQREILENLKPGTLVVIFSSTGGFLKTIYPGNKEVEKQAGTKIWMITTNQKLLPGELVDETINTKTGEDLAGSNICLELIGELIALTYWNKYIKIK